MFISLYLLPLTMLDTIKELQSTSIWPQFVYLSPIELIIFLRDDVEISDADIGEINKTETTFIS